MYKRNALSNTLLMDAISAFMASIMLYITYVETNIEHRFLPWFVIVYLLASKVILASIVWLINHHSIHVPSHEKNLSMDNATMFTPAISNTQEHQKPNEVLQKKMELFHCEYQQEQEQYLLEKAKSEDHKLNAVLKYTRDTFTHLEFDENEIYQICECVRYFITNQRPLSETSVHIRKRSNVTQISLKNFAWNIAFQYGINGDATATFVIKTFSEWFANSTFDTVKKNLRTTTGRHRIMINEKIV